MVVAISILLLPPLLGLLYQFLGVARDARRFPPPGRLVDVGDHRLHVQMSGAGAWTVVFESGIAASSLTWRLVQDEVAKFARVCVYDRAGLGWSDPVRSPRAIANILGDLRAMLAAAGISSPYILVGHSFGGLLALEYAAQHRDGPAGLLLVDPLAASEWCPLTPHNAAMLRRGVRLSRRGALLARFGFVRLCLDLLRSGSRRIPKLAARVSSGNGVSLINRIVSLLTKLPPEVLAAIQAQWSAPKAFLGMAAHLEALPNNAALCTREYRLGDLPLIVLSAADTGCHRREAHAAMAAASTQGRHVIASKSGHWIQLDEPEILVEQIRNLLLA